MNARPSPTLVLASLPFLAAGCAAVPAAEETVPDVSSRVVATDAGERVLVEEVRLDAPVEEVWAAYTTEEGWTAWASPLAEIDLSVGGDVRTHYDPAATLGEEGTNHLTVVGYVPEALLILQADVAPNWPEIMKRDAEHLMNVVVFDRLGPESTRIRAYGVGYRSGEEYDRLLGFFRTANEALYERLVRYVEEGVRHDFGAE